MSKADAYHPSALLLPIILNTRKYSMFLTSIEISGHSYVKDIVAADHRAVDVFRKYGIEYCCGAKWSLDTVCLMNDLKLDELISELKVVTRTIHLAPTLNFQDWSTDFLTEYIINVHHSFLRNFLPDCRSILSRFVEEHLKKDSRLAEVQSHFEQLQEKLFPHLDEEEKIIFPYIRQLDHAYQSRDKYATLLVRTLRKPVEKLISKEHEIVSDMLWQFRQLTDNYLAPVNACTSHRVVFGKLRELDNDLVQHMYLENEILFPRAIQIERELLTGQV